MIQKKEELEDVKMEHFHEAEFQPHEKVKCISRALGTAAQFLSVKKCFLCLLLYLHQTILNTCSAIYMRGDKTH